MKKSLILAIVVLFAMVSCGQTETVPRSGGDNVVLQAPAEEADALLGKVPVPKYDMPLEQAEAILKGAKLYYSKDLNAKKVPLEEVLSDESLTAEERGEIQVEALLSQYTVLEGYSYHFRMTAKEAEELHISSKDYSDYVEKIVRINNKIKIIIASGGTIGIEDPQTGDFINVSLEEKVAMANCLDLIKVSGKLPEPAKGFLESIDNKYATSDSFEICDKTTQYILFICSKGEDYTGCFIHPALPSWSTQQRMAIDRLPVKIAVLTYGVHGRNCMVAFAAYPQGSAEWHEIRGYPDMS